MTEPRGLHTDSTCENGCWTCRFWARSGGLDGECHRHPPRPSLNHPDWPAVRGDDWCGEWKPRPEPPGYLTAVPS